MMLVLIFRYWTEIGSRMDRCWTVFSLFGCFVYEDFVGAVGLLAGAVNHVSQAAMDG